MGSQDDMKGGIRTHQSLRLIDDKFELINISQRRRRMHLSEQCIIGNEKEKEKEKEKGKVKSEEWVSNWGINWGINWVGKRPTCPQRPRVDAPFGCRSQKVH